MSIHHYSDILIVDDSGVVRSVVRKLLTVRHKLIDEASDGAAALEKILQQHVDLVISDWNMEPMGGQELLERVRATENYGHLPFIMMTADLSR